MAAVILLVAFMSSGPAWSDFSERNHLAKERALVLLAREDTQSAIDLITGGYPAADAMKIFILVSRDLYWQRKNLSAALVMGRAGLQYGLNEARHLKPQNQALAYELSSQAKVLAYDLSSFCWPGWQEPGINIPAVYLVDGQDLAHINLRLAQQLHKGDLPMSRAWWLLGAHHLAVGQYERARRAFVEGIKYATAAQLRETELQLRGYLYLADMLKDPDNERLQLEFNFILRELQNSAQGSFFSQQLITARTVFTQPALADSPGLINSPEPINSPELINSLEPIDSAEPIDSLEKTNPEQNKDE